MFQESSVLFTLIFILKRGLIYINHIKIAATGKYKVAMKSVNRR